MASIDAQASHGGDGIVALMLSDTVGFTGITRTDANGINPVRLPTVTAGKHDSLTLIDHEAALAGPIMYRLDGQNSSAWTEAPGLSLPRFTLPFLPQFSVAVQAITAYDAERVSRAKFHEVIGRPDPMVASARMSARAGTLRAAFGSYTEARDLMTALDRGQPVMFRQTEHPGQDMYLHAERVRLTAQPDNQTWELDVSYREISRPPGRLQTVAGWSFDALKTRQQSFDEVARQYATFYDVAAGRIGL